MEVALTNWFYNKLKSDNQCFLYNGNINNEITFPLLSIGKMNLEKQEAKKLVKRRVTYLMAECFQNIIRHASTSKNKSVHSSDPGFFMSRNEESKYYITSGNLIDNKDVDGLKNHLDDINKMNFEELKEKYTDILRNGEFSEKGGAGLGLIDMARKSGYKLDYKFEDYNDKSSLFYIQTILDAENESKPNSEYSLNIDFAINIYRKMIENNVLMLYKGDFSPDSIMPILKIMKDNLEMEAAGDKKPTKVHYIMIELLQNISQHAFSKNNVKDGIFLLTKTGVIYSVLAGNLVEKEKIVNFEEHLQKITNLNANELKDMYLSRLKMKRNPGINAGIGLIHLSRICSEKLKYQFQEEDNTTSFYTIKARI